MAKQIKLDLAKAYQCAMAVSILDMKAPLRYINQYIAKDISGYGTAADEKVQSREDYRKIIISGRQQSRSMKFKTRIITPYRPKFIDETTAQFRDELMVEIGDKENKHSFHLYLSTLFKYRQNKWQMLMFHGSQPEAASSSADTFHLAEAEKKLKELEQSVAQRTLELQRKNRDLEIEAALEKVRSRSLAMNKSDEIIEVAKVVFEELDGLNIELNTAFIIIFKEGSRDSEWWLTNRDNQQYASIFVKYANLTILREQFDAKEQGKELFTAIYSVKEKKELFHYLFTQTDFKYTPPERQKFIFESKAISISMAMTKKIAIQITRHTKNQLSNEENEIVKRFTKVFDQSYTRFLDLQKAEAQVREAQIQLALERVRARTMAMHKSDELHATAELMFEQVRELGAALQGVAFAICDENTRMIQKWTSIGIFSHPYDIDPIEQRMYEAWKNQSGMYVEVYEGEKQKRYYESFMQIPEFKQGIQKFIDAGYPLPTWQKNHAVPFRYGYLLFITLKPFNETDIFLRFGKVFEQTYTRFLDLQKAEAQAREAQIELGLERVRAKAMSMRHSTELADLVAVLFKELTSLGFPLTSSIIWIHDQSNEINTIWISSAELKRPSRPYNISPFYDDFFKSIIHSWKARNPKWTFVLTGKQKKDFEKAFFKELPGLPSAFKKALMQPEQVIFSASFNNFGALEIVATEPLTDDKFEILHRFGKVFDLSYTRFNDLQKAEAQAREAQIEASLERVRSRSMAMHNSDELKEVIRIVLEQFIHLKINVQHAGFYIDYKVQDDMHIWLADPNIEPFFAVLPYFNTPTWNSFLEAKEKGIAFHSDLLDFKEKNKFYKSLFKLFKVPADAKKFYLKCKGLAVSTVLLESVGLYIENFDGIPYSDDDNRVLMRFGKVFQQTYTRFLDLQKAEAQVREAQIEAALEKVRVRAMSMQNSNELKEVASEMRNQLHHLGQKALETCAIHLYDAIPDYIETWAALRLPDGEDEMVKVEASFPKKGIKIFEETIENYVAKKMDYVLTLDKSKELELFEEMKKRAPAAFKVIRESTKDKRDDEVWVYWSLSDFPGGSLVMVTHVLPEENERKLLRRFANVFGLAYQRFRDLQKAEINAKEAIKQSALDRIRADIASMRTVTDLDRITPLIWNELTILSIPFIRCGVFIMDDEKQLIHTFLSTPDGKAIAAFHIPYDTPGNIKHVISHWHEHKNYLDHWDKDAFAIFAQTLVEQGSLTSPDQYIRTVPHGGFYLHFLPFLQGMLYVGSTTQLQADEINLVQSLADAFSTAYARYEDFNKLEAAKKQVDVTLNELKATQKQLIQSEKMASLGELTAGIAHEIQNPLNFVNNFSEINKEMLEELKAERLKPNSDKVLEDELINDVIANEEKINQHGKRADAIVKGMLQHSRSSSGIKEPTDINALCDEYLRLSYHGLRAKDKSFNVTMKTDFDGTIGKINMVPQDIGRVLLNLFNNAFYAVNEQINKNLISYEPKVFVRTEKSEDIVQITVSDNGNGISQNNIDKIFQPFFTTKPTGEGTGLGLSLSYDIVKAHGGDIRVNTKENEGTEFIILLPVA